MAFVRARRVSPLMKSRLTNSLIFSRVLPLTHANHSEGTVLQRTQVYLVTELIGAPLEAQQGPWMEALLGFAQVDDTGRPDALPEGAGVGEVPNSDC
jgi:hypothetical protein